MKTKYFSRYFTVALMGVMIGGGLLPVTNARAADQDKNSEILLFRKSTCGCCGRWAEYMGKNGFNVKTTELSSLDDVKDKYHIPKKLRSCHTAFVAGKYVVEGHVPAEDVKKLLREHPAGIVGIAVPDMPVGSPGMEGDHVEHYDVLAFDEKGKTTVYDHR